MMKTKNKRTFGKLLLILKDVEKEDGSIVNILDTDPRYKKIRRLADSMDTNIKDNRRRSSDRFNHKAVSTKPLSKRELEIVENIIKGYSVFELCKIYKLSGYKLKRLSMRAHVAFKPIFRFLISIGSHKEYFITRYQLFKSCKYRYGISTTTTRVAKKLLEKQGVKLIAGSFKWFDIKSGDMYCPENSIDLEVKTTSNSYRG